MAWLDALERSFGVIQPARGEELQEVNGCAAREGPSERFRLSRLERPLQPLLPEDVDPAPLTPRQVSKHWDPLRRSGHGTFFVFPARALCQSMFGQFS